MTTITDLDMEATRDQPYVSDTVPVDVLAAICATVRKGWGDYGYNVSIESAAWGSYLFGVRHSDGSEFYLCADRYCNVSEATWNGHKFCKGETL